MNVKTVEIKGYKIQICHDEADNRTFFQCSKDGHTMVGAKMTLMEFVEYLESGYFERI